MPRALDLRADLPVYKEGFAEKYIATKMGAGGDWSQGSQTNS